MGRRAWVRRRPASETRPVIPVEVMPSGGSSGVLPSAVKDRRRGRSGDGPRSGAHTGAATTALPQLTPAIVKETRESRRSGDTDVFRA